MTTPTLNDLQPSNLSDSSLNRLNNRRRHPNFNNLLQHTDARCLIFSPDLKILVYDKSHSPASGLVLLPPTACPTFLPTPTAPHLILGEDIHQTPYLAFRLPERFPLDPFLATFGTHHATPTVAFVHLRAANAGLSQEHMSIAAHARALFEFHARHAYCGMCGHPTISDQGGARRVCSRNTDRIEPCHISHTLAAEDTCHGIWFPRTDPVVIMLVLDTTGENTLLGRSRRHPGGMYSCLAGFMEHGESIDDAVRREVAEESAITVGRVRFFASQPWPFPYSLMLGCVAEATNNRIVVDQHELQDARWFSRSQVCDMVERAKRKAKSKLPHQDHELYVPPQLSIAGQMLAAYAAKDPITSFEKKVSAAGTGML